jgi:hypothetical protein
VLHQFFLITCQYMINPTSLLKQLDIFFKLHKLVHWHHNPFYIPNDEKVLLNAWQPFLVCYNWQLGYIYKHMYLYKFMYIYEYIWWQLDFYIHIHCEIFSTTKLFNIYITSHSYHSLQVSSIQYSAISHGYIVVQQISRCIFHKWNIVPL